MLKKYNEELKFHKEDLVKRNEELKKECELMKKKLESIDGVNTSYIEKYEASKKKVHVSFINLKGINLIFHHFCSNKRNTSINYSKPHRISKEAIKEPPLMSTC